ncbi:serine/threonine protein kinase [Lignipirellula cremea]|uniref:Serine/threonine-protein kinase PknH n=1 Tax=Lignipirellula cremea TaxID=2528010 RepID=A0A518DLH8_9BACT|nr:serine/threonine-protein kinase [Lignipirellula cremea]QDU92704.1 Serine/threonine-protein kinase PknH [Lignipirellula cremea]
MSDSFDAYHLWLGIAPGHQPPDHYRLLGVEKFESDLNVIANGADRQMLYLRNFQRGKYSALSQKLLNKVALAQGVLLDPGKKAAYDAQLRDGSAEADADADELPEIDESGALFGEYLLSDHLASGSTGQVFKAVHRTMQRTVALKIMSSDGVKSEEHVARFRQKVSILGRFQHPNVVVAYDAGERDGNFFLIMEYIDGWDLHALVKKNHPLPMENVLQYFTHAANALGYAHDHRVFHRNVNPTNLLIDREAVVKVIGWGLCRLAEEEHPSDSTLQVQSYDNSRIRGSFDFMSPEQFSSNGLADERSDVYALGCSLYFALTGKRPYSARTPQEKAEAHRKKPIPSLRKLRPDVPPVLDQIFQRMLAKEPSQRIASMYDLIDEFQAVLHDGGSAQARLVLGSWTPSAPTQLPTPAALVDRATIEQPTIEQPTIEQPTIEQPTSVPASVDAAPIPPPPALPVEPPLAMPAGPPPLALPMGPPPASPRTGRPASPPEPRPGDPALVDFLDKIQAKATSPRKKS